METIIFAVGMVVMMMVIGGCYLFMMLSFTSNAQDKDE
jgi:hypothetical protein